MDRRRWAVSGGTVKGVLAWCWVEGSLWARRRRDRAAGLHGTAVVVNVAEVVVVVALLDRRTVRRG